MEKSVFNDRHEVSVEHIREQLYRLMISQLFYDGYSAFATELSKVLKKNPTCPPSNKLMNMALGVIKKELKKSLEPVGFSVMCHLDFVNSTLFPKPGTYESCYITSHDLPCHAGAFNKQGTLVATGSNDTSIKIMDVSRMISEANLPALLQNGEKKSLLTNPVLRIMKDHKKEVTCVVFHPMQTLLASGGRDKKLKVLIVLKGSQ